jgi:hypothetical protein
MFLAKEGGTGSAEVLPVAALTASCHVSKVGSEVEVGSEVVDDGDLADVVPIDTRTITYLLLKPVIPEGEPWRRRPSYDQWAVLL